MNNNSNLSEFFSEKARVELGEDETTKKEGLAKLRAWIKSQTWIKKCRDGEEFLFSGLAILTADSLYR
jgi:hypothetical protein